MNNHEEKAIKNYKFYDFGQTTNFERSSRITHFKLYSKMHTTAQFI